MSVVADEDTTVLEQMDFPFPCAKQGDHAADVLMHCRRCGEGVSLCRGHYATARDHVERYLEAHLIAVVACSECKSTALVFDELVAVVPL